jgi:hypothetical protein
VAVRVSRFSIRGFEMVSLIVVVKGGTPQALNKTSVRLRLMLSRRFIADPRLLSLISTANA